MSPATIESFKESYDWKEAVGYAPFSMDSIAEIVACEEGENDGETWVAVVKLDDGKFGFVEAGCDYTGWDCQASGEGYVCDALEELQRWKMNTSARRRLKMEIPELDHIPNRP
jgi:hypothetical protein